ncbi:glycosyltransferase [archaeon]|nr:MAG: glycosyltransferase [archaeon]
MVLAASVVICVRDRPDDLKRGFESLKKQTFKNFEVIVVDNGKTSMKDITLDYGAKYIKSAIPMNACYARNIGWKNSRGNIVAYIDDDGVAEKQWLASLLKEYKDKSVGAVGGKINLPKETNLLDDEIKNAKGIKRFIANVFKFLIDYRGDGKVTSSGQVTSLGNIKKTCYVDHIQGCNMSFRRELLEKIGGFDEKLSSGYPFRDDADAAVRVGKLGYKIVFSKDAAVFHNLGKPSPNPKFSRWSHEIKQLEHLYFVHKNNLVRGIAGHIKFYIQQVSEVVLYFIVSLVKHDMSIFRGVVAGKLSYLSWRFLGKNVFRGS